MLTPFIGTEYIDGDTVRLYKAGLTALRLWHTSRRVDKPQHKPYDNLLEEGESFNRVKSGAWLTLQDKEDILHDAYILLITKLVEKYQLKKFEEYIPVYCGVCKFMARSLYSRRTKQGQLNERLYNATVLSAEDEFIGTITERDFIERVLPEQRGYLQMLLEGYSIKDISKELNTPLRTVYQQRSRIKHQLRSYA
jgi:DNA-directed RNA polymerase specialized sigma24 family protein